MVCALLLTLGMDCEQLLERFDVMKKEHFKEHVIVNPLKEYAKVRTGAFSDDVVELLMGTAAIESKLGHFLQQIGGGPALGPFQVEPDTEVDNWNNYLRFKPVEARFVRSFMSARAAADVFDGDKVRIPLYHTPAMKQELATNLPYNMLMARIKYLRAPKALPKATDHIGMGNYWELYYQGDPSRTIGESAAEFAEAYREHCL
jgi:hypothetical protein